MHTFITQDEKQTEKLGISIGGLLKKGNVLCLSGDLGVGKTALVKGIARGIGIEEFITSPTFTIVNEYQGKYSLYHFDVYRVNDIDELDEIGFDEYIYSDAISVIEWAELIEPILPKDKIWIKISKNIGKGEDFREVLVECSGETYSGFVQNLVTAWGE